MPPAVPAVLPSDILRSSELPLSATAAIQYLIKPDVKPLEADVKMWRNPKRSQVKQALSYSFKVEIQRLGKVMTFRSLIARAKNESYVQSRQASCFELLRHI